MSHLDQTSLGYFWTEIKNYVTNKLSSLFNTSTGVQNLTPTSPFILYVSESVLICEKVGNKAYVRGTVTPSRRLTSSQDEYTITTIPEKYRPLTTVFSVFCGTGLTMFLLRVYADGNVTISRYGHQGSGYTAIPTNAFLAFEINYTVDSYN